MVSVVGFLDEGLLEQLAGHKDEIEHVSVVGFLDEGLLGFTYSSRNHPNKVSVVGFLDEGLLVINPLFFTTYINKFQWLDF